MRLTITKEHREKCGEYFDTDNCLVCTALRQEMPDVKITEGGGNVSVNDEKFYFGIGDNYRIYRAYSPGAKFPFTITIKGLKAPKK